MPSERQVSLSRITSEADERPVALVAGGARPHCLVQKFISGGAVATAVGNLVPASRHQLTLGYRGEASRLQGSINDSAHLWFSLRRRFAEYQSSEHAARNFARRRSWRVLRR